jgi:hypothetical protein
MCRAVFLLFRRITVARENLLLGSANKSWLTLQIYRSKFYGAHRRAARVLSDDVADDFFWRKSAGAGQTMRETLQAWSADLATF